MSKRRMLFPLSAVAASLVFAIPSLRWVSRKVLYPAPATPDQSAAEGRSDVEVIRLKTGAEAWFLPPTKVRNEKAPVLVFTHGNGELIDHWLDDFEVPRRWGAAVLLVEYPGYGRSGGRPSEGSITSTMRAAHDFLTKRADIDRNKIVAYGRSLGGGAAAAMARERPVAALILESTFSSVTQIAGDMGFPAVVVADPFDNLSVVERFEGPILGIHGTEDTVIPYRHALDLEKAGKRYELITLSCGHNNCPRLWREIRTFLEKEELL